MTRGANAARHRRSLLDPVIDVATRQATDASDRVAVWNALNALALAKDKVHPLLGCDDRCIKWLDGDAVRFLSRDAFYKRLARRESPSLAG